MNEQTENNSPVVEVDFDDATYLGSSEDGVYYAVGQDVDGKWRMSADVDCNTAHFTDSLIQDDGPYDSEVAALYAGYNTACDWLVTNEIRGWRTEAAKLARQYARMAKAKGKGK